VNRERKYRAWDGISMYHSPALSEGAHHLASWLEAHSSFGVTGKESIFMDWAAFVDNKGKEVYEGDIVKFHYFYQSLGEGLGVQESEHELIGVVKWAAFGWSISAIKGQHWEGYTGYESGEGESYIVDLYSMNESSIHEESFEVIGNIYQNPELLTNPPLPKE
jgi:uncharacterized phage protein (TIGR01671 family)